MKPTLAPSSFPTLRPTAMPTKQPSLQPSQTLETAVPSDAPTSDPSGTPTFFPTNQPSRVPTLVPTLGPTLPTPAPTVPATASPTLVPSTSPSATPTDGPSVGAHTPTPVDVSESATSDGSSPAAAGSIVLQHKDVVPVFTHFLKQALDRLVSEQHKLRLRKQTTQQQELKCADHGDAKAVAHCHRVADAVASVKSQMADLRSKIHLMSHRWNASSVNASSASFVPIHSHVFDTKFLRSVSFKDLNGVLSIIERQMKHLHSWRSALHRRSKALLKKWYEIKYSTAAPTTGAPTTHTPSLSPTLTADEEFGAASQALIAALEAMRPKLTEMGETIGKKCDTMEGFIETARAKALEVEQEVLEGRKSVASAMEHADWAKKNMTEDQFKAKYKAVLDEATAAAASSSSTTSSSSSSSGPLQNALRDLFKLLDSISDVVSTDLEELKTKLAKVLADLETLEEEIKTASSGSSTLAKEEGEHFLQELLKLKERIELLDELFTKLHTRLDELLRQAKDKLAELSIKDGMMDRFKFIKDTLRGLRDVSTEMDKDLAPVAKTVVADIDTADDNQEAAVESMEKSSVTAAPSAGPSIAPTGFPTEIATGQVYVMLDGSIDQMTAAVISTIEAALADKSGLPASAFKLSILPGSVILQLEISAEGVDGTKMGQALASAWENGEIPTCAGFTVEYVGFDMPTFAPTPLPSYLPTVAPTTAEPSSAVASGGAAASGYQSNQGLNMSDVIKAVMSVLPTVSPTESPCHNYVAAEVCNSDARCGWNGAKSVCVPSKCPAHKAIGACTADERCMWSAAHQACYNTKCSQYATAEGCTSDDRCLWHQEKCFDKATAAPAMPAVSASAAPVFLPPAVTSHPTFAPSALPTAAPTALPTLPPTIVPTFSPGSTATGVPSLAPSNFPTGAPTAPPTLAPSAPPSIPIALGHTDAPIPSATPTLVPTMALTSVPTFAPASTETGVPSVARSSSPTLLPTFATLAPSLSPTIVPTFYPGSTLTGAPSAAATASPTILPTVPIVPPTAAPTLATAPATVIPTASAVVPVQQSVPPTTASPTKCTKGCDNEYEVVEQAGKVLGIIKLDEAKK